MQPPENNGRENNGRENNGRAKFDAAYHRFADVLERLRRECPWDRKQTWESIRTNTIEEVFELAAAIEDGDTPNVRKELGDVFLHVAFYALIASERGLFDLADVLDSLTDKLIYRHPHIYGEVMADNTEEVVRNWEKLKLTEKGGNKGVLSGVPGALPALIKAYRIQGKAHGVGFDWDQMPPVWDKVREELEELGREADKPDNADRIEAEMGDVLFAVVNLARKLGVNPENALERTNRKFIARFNHIEARAGEMGKKLPDMTLEEMDKYWEEAKLTDG